MTHNTLPTPAETNTVRSAVVSGADAVMLSDETSNGKHPVQAVTVMTEIVRVAQNKVSQLVSKDFDLATLGIAESGKIGASSMTCEPPVEKKIIAITETGREARLMSKYHVKQPILAFALSVRDELELALVWGVRAMYEPEIHTLPLEERVLKAIEVARAIGYLDDVEDKNVFVISTCKNSGSSFFSCVFDVTAEPTAPRTELLSRIDTFCPSWLELCKTTSSGYKTVYAINVGSQTTLRSLQECQEFIEGSTVQQLVDNAFSPRLSSSERTRRLVGYALAHPQQANISPDRLAAFKDKVSSLDDLFLQLKTPSLADKEKFPVIMHTYCGRAISDRHWREERK
jgi:hypothetical protein